MRFILEKKGKRFEYAIPEGNMIVGRDRKSDISIQDSNISRHHMSVMRRFEDVTIRDLGSRNGTFVNNQKVTESKLKPGDIVRMGNLSLFFDDGSPGLEVPDGLGAANDEAERTGGATPATPEDGVPAPAAARAPAQQKAAEALQLPSAQAPAAPKAQPDPFREPPSGGDESFFSKVADFYAAHRVPVLVGLGAAAVLAIAASIVINMSRGKKSEVGRQMPIPVYDEFLDRGVAFFEKWIDRRNPEDLKAAKQHFAKIVKYHPERMTANIVSDVLETWEKSDPEYDRFDWERAKRLLNELVNHPNCTPFSKNFGQSKIQWWRNEQVTRTMIAAGDKAESDGDLEKALAEFKKLESYPKSRAYVLRKDKIPEITRRLYDKYYAMAEARLSSDDWEGAITQFETAKRFAEEKEKNAIEKRIYECRGNITEAKVFDEILDLETRGEIDAALAKVAQVPAESKNARRAEKIKARLDQKVLLRNGRDLFESGQAEAAIKTLSDQAVFSDAEAANIRDKAQKIISALERGDGILKETMEKIRAMEEPQKLSGFDSAREAWSEVKNIVGESSNVYWKRAETRMSDLTNEKIGKLYFEKAQALISAESLKKARDFIDLARQYDLSLGTKEIRMWREEAGKRYNQAINLGETDQASAKKLLQWIIDVLRTGDSEYLEKARNELSKMK